MQEDPKKPEEKKGDKKDAKEEKKDANATADGNKTAGNSSSGNYTFDWQHAPPPMRNWYDIASKKEDAVLKDDTPMKIKSNPVYKQMIGRFLTGSFKDKDMETMKQTTAKNTIRHEEIGEEKEREGMYPNKLDTEMQDYTYGERIHPGYQGYNWGNAVAPNNDYGWGYMNNQATLAPPYDPVSHFESPYYHYDG